MATVRINDKLLEEVSANANRIVAKPKSFEEFTGENTLGDQVYHRLFGHYEAQMKALPKEFFSEVMCFYVGGFANRIELKLSSSRRVPFRYPISGDVSESPVSRYEQSMNGMFISPNKGAIPELERKIDEYLEHKSACIDEGRRFTDSVIKFLMRYSTLSPALKEWPPLWDLLGDDVKNRHKRVTPRKTTKRKTDDDTETELDMDLNKMTSKVIAAKVRG